MIPAQPPVADRFEIDEELLEVFSSEAEDLLNKIYASLASIISGEPPAKPLWEIRRSAHTLKGAAGAVGLDAVAELAHLFEDAVDVFGSSPNSDISLLTDIAAALPLSVHQDPAQVREKIRVFRCNTSSDISESERVKPPELAPLVVSPTMESTNPASVARVSLLRIDRCVELSSQLASSQNSTEPLGEFLLLLAQELQRHNETLHLLLSGADASPEVQKALRELAVIESSISRLAVELTASIKQGVSDFAELTTLLGSMRYICFGTIEPRLRGAIRAASEEAGTKCDLVIKNGSVELDTVLLSEMAEPILHILRNAAVHGIEPPQERKLHDKLPAGTITLEIRQNGRYLEIKISDDGRGIDIANLKKKAVENEMLPVAEADRLTDSEALDLIFLEGLSTARSLGMTAGRGVGMCIVRESVESQGGSLNVESELGRGTTFTVRLSTGQPQLKIVNSDDLANGAQAGTVLLVDDSASVRFSASTVLKANGWSVVTAEDGARAIEVLNSIDNIPDVIISDIEMPNVGGLELLRALKAHRRFSTIPVVICSSRNDDDCIATAKSSGAARYLVKPFDEADLVSIIRNLI